MRIRFLLVCVSAGLFGGGFAVQACGGTEEAAPGADGGIEAAAETGPRDSSVPDAKDAAPPCDPTRDFLAEIPDASIADGATTTGICVGCAQQKCKADIDKCAKDCPCQNLASGALECFLKTQALTCAAPFASANSDTRAIGFALVGCIQSECKDECAADAFDPDAGPGDAGEDADAN